MRPLIFSLLLALAAAWSASAAGPTPLPQLTLPFTGLVKSSTAGLAAAASGTDYVSPNSPLGYSTGAALLDQYNNLHYLNGHFLTDASGSLYYGNQSPLSTGTGDLHGNGAWVTNLNAGYLIGTVAASVTVPASGSSAISGSALLSATSGNLALTGSGIPFITPAGPRLAVSGSDIITPQGYFDGRPMNQKLSPIQACLLPTLSWENNSVCEPCLIFENNTFKMWYDGGGVCGYAISPDGYNWTKNPLPVAGNGYGGVAAGVDCGHASIYEESGTYYLIYSGGGVYTRSIVTSTDGVTFSNPQVIVTDTCETGNSSLVKSGTTYYLFHESARGAASSPWHVSIYTGTSPLGPYTQSGTSAWNTGLDCGYAETGCGKVMKSGTTWHFWGHAGDNRNGTGLTHCEITHATSTDLLNWTVDPYNPVIFQPHGSLLGSGTIDQIADPEPVEALGKTWIYTELTANDTGANVIYVAVYPGSLARFCDYPVTPTNPAISGTNATPKVIACSSSGSSAVVLTSCILPFNTVSVDTCGCWTGVTGTTQNGYNPVTGGLFPNYAFVPNKAGFYDCKAWLNYTGSPTSLTISKNGVGQCSGPYLSSVPTEILVYCNGTTDYITAGIYVNGTSINANLSLTQYSGFSAFYVP